MGFVSDEPDLFWKRKIFCIHSVLHPSCPPQATVIFQLVTLVVLPLLFHQGTMKQSSRLQKFSMWNACLLVANILISFADLISLVVRGNFFPLTDLRML